MRWTVLIGDLVIFFLLPILTVSSATSSACLEQIVEWNVCFVAVFEDCYEFEGLKWIYLYFYRNLLNIDLSSHVSSPQSTYQPQWSLLFTYLRHLPLQFMSPKHSSTLYCCLCYFVFHEAFHSRELGMLKFFYLMTTFSISITNHKPQSIQFNPINQINPNQSKPCNSMHLNAIWGVVNVFVLIQ